MMPLQKLFDLRGRIRRRDYWIYSLIVALVSVCVTAVGVLGLGMDREDPKLEGVVSVLVFWPNLAISVKRLHDRDKTGWFYVPFFVVPMIVQMVAVALNLATGFVLLINVLTLIPVIWGLIEMGFRDTIPGENRFGPSPKASTVSPNPFVLEGPALPGGDAKA